MFKKLLLVILFFAAVALFVIAGPLSLSRKQEFNTIEAFNKEDRVLILAPHPDDEAIGTAGVIQRCLKAGIPVKVAYLTCGDFNELSYLLSRMDIAIFPGEFANLGRQRRKEAIRAMNYLGLHDNDLVFLGYPDFGTLEIMLKYWGGGNAFEHPVTGISRVPYREALSYNASYTGESILKDLETAILDFKPTKIFVSHPADTNQDHRALYLFLRVALWDLEGKITDPEVFPYIVHVVGWPRPRGYRPKLELIPPQGLKGIEWNMFCLKSAEVGEKRTAISMYPSQIRCAPAYLYSFARKNELFGDYPVIRLKQGEAGKIIWNYLGGRQVNPESKVSNLAYAVMDGNLFIKFNVRKGTKERIDMLAFLLGYSKEKKFSAMPKIRLDINKAKLLLRDKEKGISVEGASFEHVNQTAFIKLPLSALGDPDYILSCAMGKMRDFSPDEISWRVLEIEK